MVAPTFKNPTDNSAGTSATYGAADIKYAFSVLNGTHSTDRIQASVIEGIQKPYTAIVRPEGANFVARNPYGGVISSTTSAQTALQAAFDQAGHIWVGPGLYPITSIRTVPSNTYIECHSGATIQGTGTHALLRNVDQTGGNTNIMIRGGTWDCNCHDLTTNFGTHGTIDFRVGGPFWIDHVRSIWANSEGLKVQNGHNVFLTNNYVFHTRLQAESPFSGKAGIIAAQGTGECVIANNIVEDAGGESIGCYDLSSGCIVVNNICRRLSYGRGHILLEGSASTAEEGRRHIIANNYISTRYYGINIMSNLGTVIANNHITTQSGATTNGPAGTGEAAIRVYGESEGTIVTGNHIWDTEVDGILVGVEASEVLITNNLIRNVGRLTANTYDGIKVKPGTGSNPSNIRICNNIIGDDRSTPRNRYAIRFELGAQTINNCWVHDNLSYGHASSNGVSIDLGTSGDFEGETRFFNNSGGGPGVSKLATPFKTAAPAEVGMSLHGGATYTASPSASTTYTVVGTNISMTATGGTAVSMTVEDDAGTNLITTVSTSSNPVRGLFLRRGWRVNFGAFTGAPTVTVFPHG
jgi:hypothetical protein